MAVDIIVTINTEGDLEVEINDIEMTETHTMIVVHIIRIIRTIIFININIILLRVEGMATMITGMVIEETDLLRLLLSRIRRHLGHLLPLGPMIGVMIEDVTDLNLFE